jgi:hypothetical protein
MTQIIRGYDDRVTELFCLCSIVAFLFSFLRFSLSSAVPIPVLGLNTKGQLRAGVLTFRVAAHKRTVEDSRPYQTVESKRSAYRWSVLIAFFQWLESMSSKSSNHWKNPARPERMNARDSYLLIRLIQTDKIAISAGLTPDIRDAWPRFSGRISASFSRDSRRSAEISW